MARQSQSCKQGLEESQRLEMTEDNKTTISLITWITWISLLIINGGIDTVFKILNRGTKETDLLQNWRTVTREKLKDWVDWLKNTGTSSDLCDCQNLHLSGFVIRSSLNCWQG